MKAAFEANFKRQAIAQAYLSGAYTMQQIGAYFGVGRMTVSRAVKHYERSGTNRSVQWET